jgi:hypothetical protein
VSYTYSVIRGHRDTDGSWNKVEASGLSLEAARAKEAELTKAEKILHPEKTCWTRDVFCLELEEKGTE